MTGTFFSDFGASISEVGRRSILVTAAVCLASAGVDVAAWMNGGSLPFFAFISAALIPAYVGAIYLGVMSILSLLPTMAGYLRFLCATVLTFAPIGIAIGAHFGLGEQGVPIIVIMAALGLMAIVILPAWPVAQALSSTPLSPLRVFMATKGHRWGLVIGTFAVSAFNKFDMDIPAASNATEALLRGLGAAGIGTISAAVLGAFTATAFRFAVRNDSSLRGTGRSHVA